MADVIDLFDDGGPGRSRVVSRPSARTQARIARHRAAVEEHETLDPLLAVARSAERLETLYAVREQMARETAALLFSRLNLRPGAREIGRTASRRIAALAEVGRLTVEIARADPGAPSAAVMKRICLLLLSDIEAAAAEVFDDATTGRLTTALRVRLDDDAIEAIVALR